MFNFEGGRKENQLTGRVRSVDRARVHYFTRLPLEIRLAVFDALPKVWDLILTNLQQMQSAVSSALIFAQSKSSLEKAG